MDTKCDIDCVSNWIDNGQKKIGEICKTTLPCPCNSSASCNKDENTCHIGYSGTHCFLITITELPVGFPLSWSKMDCLEFGLLL